MYLQYYDLTCLTHIAWASYWIIPGWSVLVLVVGSIPAQVKSLLFEQGALLWVQFPFNGVNSSALVEELG